MMWTRRKFISALAAGGAGMAALPNARGETAADVELRLAITATRTPIFLGAQTPTLRFVGEVLRGRPDALRASRSFLGPTLDLRRGEHVRIHVENRLPEASVVHWHGMLVPEAADGHPRLSVAPGSSYTIEFTVTNPAGTYFYHPHPHGRTGLQVYYGLAGMLIVREPVENELGLPERAFELPLVVQDRIVAPDNSFVFNIDMMAAMEGVLGDTVLVNGQADAVQRVAPRAYRLRIVNASNARIYKLAWSDGEPLHVIGGDSGLYSSAEGVQTRASVVLAPAERIDVVEDFGRRRPGAEIALMSQAFSSGGGMMGGMMGRGMMGVGDQGKQLLISRFAVSRATAKPAAPISLPDSAPVTPERASERFTELGFFRMQGTLNGRTFAMDEVADDERLPVGHPVVWTFANPASTMMSMPHPMHIHGVRFRVLERRGGGPARDLAEGILDAGFKDTVLVLPGEQVQVAFTPDEPGRFLYHCHNLEHEDGGMMRNVDFVA